MICINLVLIFSLLNYLQFGLGRVIIKLCVPEDQISQCRGLSHLYSAIHCVPVRDKFACMGQIARNRADIVKVGPEDLYVAGSIFGLEPFMFEEINGKRFKEESAILVRKDSNINRLSDLKGKRSCHSGFGQVAGWNIPISKLISDGVMKENCKGEKYSAEDFFSSSCAPGNWSEDPFIDNLLKQKHYKLCNLCQNPSSCSSKDQYAGTEGAIQCLVDNQADVAFTTLESIFSYFTNFRYIRDDYQLLCPNGGVASITNPCKWIGEPTEVWISRSNTTQKLMFHNILEQIHFRIKNDDNYYNSILASNRNVTRLSYLSSPDINKPYTYIDYLGDYIKTIKLSNSNCSKPVIRLCTRNQMELSKCLDLQKVAYSRRSITFRIMCENPGSSVGACIDAIRKGKADIISLEANDLYQASKHRSLKPVVKEMINQSDIAYYAVAVVRNPSPITSIKMLVNTTACNTAYGDPAGWTAPIGLLIIDQNLPRNNCYPLVANYFKSMCVPGITGHTHDPNNTADLETLCGLCVGNGYNEHVCEKSSSEKYFDESGAFRCLAEKRGEVAFVRHSTPLAYTNRQILNNWSAHLRSGDFKLLCREGGQGSIEDYEKCHLASIPTRSVIMSRWSSSEQYLNTIQFLATISSVFRNANHSFKLFGRYENEENLIFNDKTTKLSSLDDGTDWENILGEFLKFSSYTDEKLCQNLSVIISANYLLICSIAIIHFILKFRTL